MAYTLQRTDKEIDDTILKAEKSASKGTSQFPGMSYEEGVAEALMWVLGEHEDNPLAD